MCCVVVGGVYVMLLTPFFAFGIDCGFGGGSGFSFGLGVCVGVGVGVLF